MQIIYQNISRLRDLCHKHKVKALYAFGSILTEHFHEDSDIDFAVNFNDNEVEDSFVNFFDFQQALEDLFSRKIDLVDYEAITSPYFKQEVANTRQLIYG